MVLQSVWEGAEKMVEMTMTTTTVASGPHGHQHYRLLPSAAFVSGADVLPLVPYLLPYVSFPFFFCPFISFILFICCSCVQYIAN